jgi:hypothetical protein
LFCRALLAFQTKFVAPHLNDLALYIYFYLWLYMNFSPQSRCPETRKELTLCTTVTRNEVDEGVLQPGIGVNSKQGLRSLFAPFHSAKKKKLLDSGELRLPFCEVALYIGGWALLLALLFSQADTEEGGGSKRVWVRLER